MTGELTLRGKVMPIGGIKEKVLAAYRSGIKTVILPKKNEQDLLEDLPKELRDQMEFVYAAEILDVLKTAIEGYAEQLNADEAGSNGHGGKGKVGEKAAAKA